jgi:hypothetical protein
MADRLISCDDHMDLSQLPADLWTSRLPKGLLDRAPSVEERDGRAVWAVTAFTVGAGAALLASIGLWIVVPSTTSPART